MAKATFTGSFPANFNNREIIGSKVPASNKIPKKRIAKTKQRNEIIGSTRKIYAQKGTGGARHSSRKAPIFVGGGIAHGPKGDNYKTKSINKKIVTDALVKAEQDIQKTDISDQNKYLLDQKIEVLKSISLN